jgi:hypothetical protein
VRLKKNAKKNIESKTAKALRAIKDSRPSGEKIIFTKNILHNKGYSLSALIYFLP